MTVNFLRRRRGPALPVLLFSLCGFLSCGSCKTPSISQPQAETDSSVFYRALRTEAQLDHTGALELFEEALDSPSVKVRAEAALKTAALLSRAGEAGHSGTIAERLLKRLERASVWENPAGDGAEPALRSLKTAALYAAGRYHDILRLYDGLPDGAIPPQDRAYLLLSRWILAPPSQAGTPINANGRSSTDYAREFFYAPREGTAAASREQDELFRTTLAGMEKHHAVFSGPDSLILEGRFALSRSDYGKAARLFEDARKEGGTAHFFRYPGILGDLGRSFQWTASRRAAGLKLFNDWEKALMQNPRAVEGAASLSGEEISNLRYQLLFYAGRIARQQGKHADAAEYFTRAIEFAPDRRQEDACLWYILDCGFTAAPGNAAALVQNCARRWHDSRYFEDVLDSICCYLAARGRWADIGAILGLIRENGGAESAQYAYIMGRAVAEGLVSVRGRIADDYFAIAYEEGNASFYYRALAASHLGKAVVPAVSGDALPLSAEDRAMMDFYQGFFEYGAGPFVQEYLRKDRERLSAPVLRAAASHLAEAGQYLDSINLTRSYMRREGYEMERADLELYYPRAFTGLIDANARNAGIRLPVFYGLVRTESAFMPDIESHAGAVGLAQIMPATAREINAMIKRQGGPDFAENGSIDLRNPEINIRMGAAYLSYLTRSLGSPLLALLAYNGGPGRIRRLRRAAPGLPEDLFLETIAVTETREYGKRVMAAACAYGYLYYDMSMEGVVADMLK